MVERTSTRLAPWTLVEADNKLHARVKVIRTLAERVEAALRKTGKG
jgi:polyphosphate kinase 2 (PPK2 family)